MKKLLIIILFLGIFQAMSFAQNQNDALRYSQLFYGGTTRFVTMGGSFGALGADMSVMSINPAGIGLFQRSEISFTPSLASSKTSSDFSGRSTNDNAFNFNLNNIGFVGTFKGSSSDKGWQNVNFGIAYNKINDFNQNIYIEGKNDRGSFLDYLMENSDGTDPDDLYEFMEYQAWNTYLLDTVAYSNLLYTNPLYNRYNETQSKSITRKGYMGEYDFSFAANYSHMLYIGATLGIQNIRYSENSSYQEIADLASNLDFKSFNFKESLSTRGTGINFKFGMILRPVDILRIGFAIHSPSLLSMKDEYSTSMDSYWNTPDADNRFSYSSNSNLLKSEYEITTPMRVMGSLGVVLLKSIALNADYEFVDYTTARMRDPNNDYDYNKYENKAIQDQFKGVSNIRLGGEYVLGQFKFRAGYGLYGSPYKDTNRKASRSSISAGFGIVANSFFMDAGVVKWVSKDKYYLYDGKTDEPVPELKYASTQFMLTFGVKF